VAAENNPGRSRAIAGGKIGDEPSVLLTAFAAGQLVTIRQKDVKKRKHKAGGASHLRVQYHHMYRAVVKLVCWVPTGARGTNKTAKSQIVNPEPRALTEYQLLSCLPEGVGIVKRVCVGTWRERERASERERERERE
jgi:hypothetical protein